MTNDNRFYTYAYLRLDRTPYYIGKGCGRRAYRNHGRVPVPPRDRILILKKNLTQKEALRHEIYMIAVFGRKDLGTGCLRNMTDGGDGTGRRVWTPEQRANQSKKHTGKKMSVTARRKISRAKIGKKASEQTRRKMSAKKRGKKLALDHAKKLRQRCLDYNKNCKGATWWVHDSGKSMQAHECPGEGWQQGRNMDFWSEDLKQAQRNLVLGKKWWVNATGETTMAHDCPGKEWQRGRVWKEV